MSIALLLSLSLSFSLPRTPFPSAPSLTTKYPGVRALAVPLGPLGTAACSWSRSCRARARPFAAKSPWPPAAPSRRCRPWCSACVKRRERRVRIQAEILYRVLGTKYMTQGDSTCVLRVDLSKVRGSQCNLAPLLSSPGRVGRPACCATHGPLAAYSWAGRSLLLAGPLAPAPVGPRLSHAGPAAARPT